MIRRSNHHCSQTDVIQSTASTRRNSSFFWCVLLGLVSFGDDRPALADTCAWIEFRGPITPLSEVLFDRKLERARELGVDVVVIEIDSPGGMLGPSVALAESLITVDWATTIAYIPREAISGAAIMALGCDRIIMKPGARIGDAGPVIEGDDAQFREAPSKIVSYLSRIVRDLAKETGKPQDVAAAMVEKQLVLVIATNTKTEQRQAVAKSTVEANPDNWKLIEPLPASAKEKYLTLNGEQALNIALASDNVADADALEKQLNLHEPPHRLRQSAVDIVLLVLNSPISTGILVFIGFIALIIELTAPGIGVGTLISGLCFSLFFWSHLLGGTAGWLEVILFVSGIVFVAMEIFVIPGFGVAGVSGVGCVMASVVMASFQGHLPDERAELIVAGKTAAAFLIAGGAGVIVLFLIGPKLEKMPLLKHLLLAPPQPSDDHASSLAKTTGSGDVSVVPGDEGIAESPLRPAGRAQFGDRFLDVVSDGSFVEVGQVIKVVQIEGHRIVVRPVS